VNRQPRDHEIREAPAPSERDASRRSALQPVRRPVLQGHVLQRHLPGGELAASRAAAPQAVLIEPA
jgi:hypothetical protein